MKSFTLSTIPAEPSPSLSLYLYNALDCGVTVAALLALKKDSTPASDLSYSFSRAMRAPALFMMEKGIRVDMEKRGEFIKLYEGKLSKANDLLQRFAFAVWDKPLNPESPKQLIDFFYNTMKITPIISYKKGERKVSMDRDTLEKLDAYLVARPIISLILSCRDYRNKLEVLNKSIDKERDGHYRLRTSYNVVGTETQGRWSSSENAFDQGTNMQNITDELRRMLIPDPGFKFAYLDLEQAESRAVAYISGDKAYIKACESGDLHTTVCMMTWPGLIKDRKDADQIFYRHLTYRDMAKKLGHGSNYFGQPKTMAMHAKIPVPLATQFQDSYFSAFPSIPLWHKRVAQQLQTCGYITSATGSQRFFLSRRFDNLTLREAIAHEPQCLIGQLLNLYLFRIWKSVPIVTCLAQIHDAVLIQYRKELEHEVISRCLPLASTPITFPSGTLIIPSSAEVGFNWGKANAANPFGLKKWKGKDEREEPRIRGLLDRPVSLL